MKTTRIRQLVYTLAKTASFTAVLLAATITFSSPLATAQSTQPNMQTQAQPSDTTTTAPTDTNNVANNICRGVLSTTGDASPDTTISSCQETDDSSFGFLIRRIINVFSIVVGAVSVIMIIIGGFRYIISGGDSGSISGAKNTILYAIVGLVIVVFAQVIVRFVLANIAPIAG